jgi:putative spermidine/putrescine transport system permease protein
MLSKGSRLAVRGWTVLILLFLYIPLALVLVNAFNSSRTFAFPPTGFTTKWWVTAWNSEGMWKSLGNSVIVGLCATAIALVLGSMAAFAVQRYRFFGRDVVSLLVVLPITLPGIVTGIALNATFTSALGVTLGLATVIVGHATFCIVIVFNNTQARLRRLGAGLEDASADLDLRQPVPAESGSGHQRGGRGAHAGRGDTGVAGPALRRRPGVNAGVSQDAEGFQSPRATMLVV